MKTTRLRAGLTAGAVAGAVSGAPSTVHSLVTRRSPLDAVRASGTLLLGQEARPRRLVVAGVAAHGVLSLGWGMALAVVLPRRRAVLCGAVAGLAIAGMDLGILGGRWPRIRTLPLLPQIADHVVYGAVVGAVLTSMEHP
jgi:hypothetical protein